MSEQRRIDLVCAYHRRARVRLPSLKGHATLHVIVENQLATAEPVVVETLARLHGEGLTRDAAIDAIGSVLLEHLNWLIFRVKPEATECKKRARPDGRARFVIRDRDS